MEGPEAATAASRGKRPDPRGSLLPVTSFAPKKGRAVEGLMDIPAARLHIGRARSRPSTRKPAAKQTVEMLKILGCLNNDLLGTKGNALWMGVALSCRGEEPCLETESQAGWLPPA